MADIKVGQIWIEVDPRFERYVRIKEIGGSCDQSVAIQTCVQDRSGEWVDAPRSRRGWASIERFNGKRGNYALHETVL